MNAANEAYLRGGLAAIYPSVYGPGGLRDKIADEQPKDRWAPSLATMKAQLANGVISRETFDKYKHKAVK